MHKVLFHDVKTKQSKPIMWEKERKNREINLFREVTEAMHI